MDRAGMASRLPVQSDVAADGDVGGVILSRAMDHGSDLIVMGIYGHPDCAKWSWEAPAARYSPA